ncbi:MAG: nucleoside-triphosphatase [Syntrophotaleaceae bacterium]
MTGKTSKVHPGRQNRGDHGPLILISGPPHIGKSSLVAELVRQLRALGWRIAGILAEGHWQNDRRSAFTLIDLSDGKRTPLAVRTDPAGSGGFPYAFYPEGLAAGRLALSLSHCAGADILVVDEVGSLEIQGKGWADHLRPLLELPVIHLWVVQSARVAGVCRRWGISPLHVICADETDATARLLKILQNLDRSSSGLI